MKIQPIDASAVSAPVARETGHRKDELEASFHEVEPSLLSVANRMCRNRSDANDLVRDTFEGALRSSSAEPPRNVRAWLAVILHRLFVDRSRALTRRTVPEALHAVQAVGARPGQEPVPCRRRATIVDVREALAEIDPEFRVTYEMHVFRRRSYDEIAAALGIERATVGTRLDRARHRLRAVLCRRLGQEADP